MSNVNALSINGNLYTRADYQDRDQRRFNRNGDQGRARDRPGPPGPHRGKESLMSEFKPGLEGVVAFETEIAEPDREGGSLRYRGVDIEELVGQVPFGQVWGLLVDNAVKPGLPPAGPDELPLHTGIVRVDVQCGTAALACAWGLRPLFDSSPEQAREDVGQVCATMLSFIAQSARGADRPAVPQHLVDEADSAAEAFLIRWRGEPDPAHVKALDAYWVSAAEHGMNASTFTARVIASTGADVAAAMSGAVGALSGPLHGGAPARVLHMINEVERTGDAEGYVKATLDRHDRLMGFGHRVYRAEDPRAAVLRRTAKDLGAPRYEVALALENAALAELRARRPDRALETNVEFWAAIVLDFAQIPAEITPSMFTCARTAGWAAHIMEEKRTGRLIRPSARYVGPVPREAASIVG
jgi:citrate synthase